jgi:hypothetical protein
MVTKCRREHHRSVTGEAQKVPLIKMGTPDSAFGSTIGCSKRTSERGQYGAQFA